MTQPDRSKRRVPILFFHGPNADPTEAPFALGPTFETVKFSNAIRALRHCASGDLKAALIDLRTTGESGIDLARQLRDHGFDRPIIIAGPGVSRAPTLAAGLRVDHVDTNAVHSVELANRIHTAIEAHHALHELRSASKHAEKPRAAAARRAIAIAALLALVVAALLLRWGPPPPIVQAIARAAATTAPTATASRGSQGGPGSAGQQSSESKTDPRGAAPSSAASDPPNHAPLLPSPPAFAPPPGSSPATGTSFSKTTPAGQTAPTPAAFGASVNPPGSSTPPPLAASLAQVIAAGAVDGASLTVSASQGNPLYQHNPDVPRTPASAIKLVVAAVALAQLGNDFRFTTSMGSQEAPRAGVLARDLIVRGDGDPSLVTSDLVRGVAMLHREGIRRINGSLVVLTSPFSTKQRNAQWLSSDLTFPYAAGSAAITLDGNSSAGVAIKDVPQFTGATLARVLRDAGISVGQGVRVAVDAPQRWNGWNHRSAPLTALLHEMLSTSDNLAAEQILRRLGVARLT